jgi:DnaJ family protein B protein 4
MFFNFGNGGGFGGGEPNMDDSGNNGEDYYKTLGVDETAGDDEIKKSYRKLSMIHHPDKNGNTDESKQKFQELNQAYETLSNPNERRKYDMMRKFGPGGGGMGIGGFPGGIFHSMNGMGGRGHGPGANVEHVFQFGGAPQGPGIPDEILQMLFGMGGGMGGMGGMGGGGVHGGMPGGPKVVFQAFHNGVPVHQHHSMPGHGHGHGPRVVQVPPPETIIKTVSLSLEQSYNGCSIPLEIDRHIPDNGIVRIERETLHVQIPKGVLQGDNIILNDSGNINEAGVKGDVRIIINILQHTIFKVENLDLHIEKTITLKDALCGFNFEIHHLSGKIFQLSNKPGNIIKPGSVKTIPNLGLEKNGETGSIKIKFQVEFPDTLTDEQIQTLSRGL